MGFLASAENLDLGTIDFRGVGDDHESEPMLDGASVVLDVPFAVSGQSVFTLGILGNLDSPAWSWWESESEGLKSCWTDVEPV